MGNNNSTSIASRLPSDVLFEIFSHCPSVGYLYDGWQAEHRLPEPLVLTRVCSSWRQAARTHPNLWRTIPLNKPAWTRLALQLSDPLSIDVSVAYDVSSPPAFDVRSLEILVHSFSRLRSLYLSGDPDGVPELQNSEDGAVEILSRLGASETPLLETVSLSYRDFDQSAEARNTFSNFIGTRRPKVSSLSLSFCHFETLANLRWQSITHFCLSNCDTSRPLEETLLVLVQMPALKFLKLHKVMWPDATPSNSPTIPKHSVILPTLSRLQLGTSIRTIHSILSYISFPVGTNIQLHMNAHTSAHLFAPTSDFSSILSMLSEHFSKATQDGQSFRSLEILDSPSMVMKIGASTLTYSSPAYEDSRSTNTDYDLSPSCQMKLEVQRSPWILESGTYASEDHRPLVPFMLSALPILHGVRSLYLHPYGERSESRQDPTNIQPRSINWDDLLAPLQYVEEFRIASGETFASFARAVRSRDEAGSSPLLPRLRTLHITSDDILDAMRLQESVDEIGDTVRQLVVRCPLRLIRIDANERDLGWVSMDGLQEVVDVIWGGVLLSRLPVS
ncbi:hypothetical protein K488DRAFT_87793 [Vararia minispora EC-137]|uniref:Uncharacterized protein n=1 Tax=Vararia minispora EC-137 TaxID=1314806 RepID=A0ACB8QFP0_9AGAM|nr:hypothetical protein K488DRAFT_87793 [Vararia minispora EC-137]